MKRKLLLLALLAQFCSLTTMAYDAYIDGIYYNFFRDEATVTFKDKSFNSYSRSVTIPSCVNYNGKTYMVTEIGESAFSGSSITSVSIPNSVTSIGDCAFRFCENLTSIIIPNSVTNIGIEVFWGCEDLSNITIPESITTIGIQAFEASGWLHNQPDGLVYAGKVVYKYKGTIPENTSIEVKEGTLAIADYAFKNCSGLTSISIPESIISIGNEAFEGTEWFENQPDGLVYAGKVAYKYKGTMPKKTEIEIKDGTLGIASYAFEGCSGLTSIIIPESVTNIDEAAFENCPALTSIVVEEGNVVYDSRNDCNAIIETATNTLIKGCRNTLIPEGVTCIGNGAFSACYDLTSVTIPESVTTIGNGAFSSCYVLTSITIPESVTTIGERAFSWCLDLTSITIPEGVASIGYHAFFRCDNLSSIIISKSVTNIDEAAFANCPALTSIVVEEGNVVYDSRNDCNAIIETATNTLIIGCRNTLIPEGVTSIGNGAFSGCDKLTSITIPESVINIGGSAFRGSGLLSVIIPGSVTSIEYNAFFDTPWLENQPEGLVYAGKVVYKYKGTMPENTSINLREGTLGIAGGAFEDCTGLISVNIPESVAIIGADAFRGCNNLTSVNIPAGVTEIGSFTFFGCKSIVSITIPKGVTSIGLDAFYGCSSLTSIILPEGLIRIGNSAFGWCTSLTSIIIPKSVTKIDYSAFYQCHNICIVKSEMRDPVPVSKSTFDYSWGKLLYVPKGSKEAYQTADVWKDFKEIIECDYVDVTEQTIAVGGSTTMEISVNNFDNDLVAFQMDLTLPEGVSLDKTGCSLSSRITDKEQELTIGKLENGAYRLTSSSLSLTPISGNDGTLITLKLTAEEGSIGGQATISNIRFSTSNSNRLNMDDETFDINVMYKVIYIVDGEENKTVNVLYNTPITPETELTKEGYTFSGWSEIPETMPAHDVEVTGSFTINKYKLTYMVDDVEYKSYEIDYATAITPEAAPSKDGYTFSAWIGLPETMPAHDVEVTGAFTVNSYTLTYKVDGEVHKTSPVVYGTELTIEAEPTKDGYTFGGWSELPETMPAHDVEVTGRFYLFGDVNTDEEVDVVDVVDVARFVVATPSEKFREKLADLNFDNTVNLGDAVVLVNHIAGDQNFVREMFASERSTNTGVLSLTRNGKTLALNLTNGQAYTAFQFDLYVAEDADITLMMLNGQRKQKHQLLYNKVEDGHYRVAALSTSNNEFNGNEGELLNITMNGVSGDEVSVRNIHFFDVKGNDYLFDDIEGSIVTSIENIEHSTLNIEQPIYNAAGLRLNKMQKGINIVGDKKVVVK